jgi:hypothetical protein
MPRTPGTPRLPLGEVSPGRRNRIVGARDHGIKFGPIARLEELSESTCRQIVKNAPHQTSCISNPRSGRPPLIKIHDQRRIFRAISINPKITAAQLIVDLALPCKKKSLYRFLKKSGIQKWRCRKRPLLNDERAAARLVWALKYNNLPIEFWRRWAWSDECSIERGKGGKWDFCYRKRGIYLIPSYLEYILTTS